MILCPEGGEGEGGGGKTALIDQRAVAAGKNSLEINVELLSILG